MTIYKYPLEIKDRQHVKLPAHAQILSVQVQHGNLQLWAIVDEDFVQQKMRCIEIIATGGKVSDEPRKYIGTVQQMNGALVWHVFELL